MEMCHDDNDYEEFISRCDACGEDFLERSAHKQICQGPFPAKWWSEDEGDVLWWCWQDGQWLGEPPYVGSPLDLGHSVVVTAVQHKTVKSEIMVGGWPGYHTHWTRLPKQPNPPRY